MTYKAVPLPDAPESVNREFSRIEQSWSAAVPFVFLATLNVAPDKPRAGMVALADGTNWNPGSGAGVYAYYGGAWVKLG